MDEAHDRTTQLQDLLDRLHAGDEAARPALIEHAYGRLERLARRELREFPRLRRTRETGDVLNDAVLTLDRALRQVRPKTVREFFALASTHMRRLLIDLIRRRREVDRGDMGTGAPEPDSTDSTAAPATRAGRAELHERVEALPPEEREVVDLLFYQGLQQAEAAAILGVSERTVKRRWRAARLALDRALGDDAEGP